MWLKKTNINGLTCKIKFHLSIDPTVSLVVHFSLRKLSFFAITHSLPSENSWLEIRINILIWQRNKKFNFDSCWCVYTDDILMKRAQNYSARNTLISLKPKPTNWSIFGFNSKTITYLAPHLFKKWATA